MADAITAGELTLDRMRADLAAILYEDIEEIDVDDDLMELGLDSIRAMSLLAGWSELGVRCGFTDLAAAEPTLNGWWKFLSTGGNV